MSEEQHDAWGETAGAMVAEQRGDGVTPARLAKQRAAVVEAAESAPTNRRVWLYAAAAVAVVLAVGIGIATQRPEAATPPSTAAPATLWVEASEQAVLREVAGTQMSLDPHTRVQVEHSDTDEGVVQLGLADGSALLDRRGPGHASIQLGPSRLVLRSGRVHARWNAEQALADIEVSEGSAELFTAGETHHLAAGHHVQVAAGVFRTVPEVQVTRARATRPPPPPPEQSEPQRPEPPAPPSAKELRRRADAARLAGDTAKARKLLRTLRTAHPKSRDGRLAPFLLGRLAFDVDRNYKGAAKWFATYVREQPRGPFVGEARGRLIDAQRRAGNGAAARTAALDYLEHHPQGAYSKLASSLAAPPP